MAHIVEQDPATFFQAVTVLVEEALEHSEMTDPTMMTEAGKNARIALIEVCSMVVAEYGADIGAFVDYADADDELDEPWEPPVSKSSVPQDI